MFRPILIDLTCRKAKKKLGFIYRQFHCAPPQVVTNLYKQLVLPQLDYCSSVWDPYQKNQISALESVQSFAKKIIFRDWGATASVSTVDVQRLSGRCSFQKLVLYYKILNHLSILNPVDFFTNHPSFVIPIICLCIILALTRFHLDTLFFISAIPLWNSLPWHKILLKKKNYSTKGGPERLL